MNINFEDHYKPHVNQLDLHKSKAKYRVVVAGRRFGKSAFGLNEALARSLKHKRQITWIVLPTYKQAKEIYWVDPDIIKYFMPYVHAGVIKKNDSELSLYIKPTESWIRLKGADNPDSLRGSGLDLIIWDEVAEVKQVAFNVVEPSLADSPDHRVIYIGTPKGYNHFYDFALRGDHRGIIEKIGRKYTLDPDWYTWHFTSYDNMAWGEGTKEREQFVKFIDKKKKEVDPTYFSQEYLAKFVLFTGLIYTEFDQQTHLDIFDHEKDSHADYIFGLDFAVRGYTAALALKITSDDKIYILDEYKKRADTAKNHAKNIIEMLEQYASLDKWVGYADPTGFAKNQQKGDLIWSLADDYLDEGVPITPGNNEVTPGINYVKQLLRDDKIKIHARCKELVEEIRQYQWKDQTDKQKEVQSEPEKPRKINDHLVDSLRYALYSKPVAPEEQQKTPESLMSIKFPPPRIEEEKDDGFTKIDIPSIYD